jgi:hypothetical protein
MHIFRTAPSYDQIFPAKKPKFVDDHNSIYYYNSDPRATVLGCIDSTELCAPGKDECWSMASDAPPDVRKDPAYWFMKWSLTNSNTYNSIKWRLGRALLAQERLGQSIYAGNLDSNHWESEAEQLFATSLARIQFDADDIATGAGKDLPGYIDQTPDEARGQLCRLYKSRTTEYTNVNLVAFVGLLLILPVSMLLSKEVTFRGKNKLLIFHLIRLMRKLASLLAKACRTLLARVKRLFANVGQGSH